MVLPASSTRRLPASTLSTESPISALISLAAAAERWARLRTSEATTAKPRPCSPARAASTAAFSARILVWKAMPSMTPMMSTILLDDSLIEPIVSTTLPTTAPPSRPPPRSRQRQLVGLARVVRVLLDGRGQLLHRRRRFFQRAGLLLGAATTGPGCRWRFRRWPWPWRRFRCALGRRWSAGLSFMSLRARQQFAGFVPRGDASIWLLRSPAATVSGDGHRAAHRAHDAAREQDGAERAERDGDRGQRCRSCVRLDALSARSSMAAALIDGSAAACHQLLDRASFVASWRPA
jgi:hypothetical protein